MTNKNNIRIAKNTLMLYIRQVVTLLVSLYTVRIVLKALGVEDYGIYNVVGGFVGIMGILSASMSTATQRFLAFEIGKENQRKLNQVFSMSVNIHFIVMLLILLLAETLGLWFLNSQLTIPSERMEAALWVYQFSILASLIGVISVPYNAIIIAHERMSVFAWISIAEVGLKLLLVIILQWASIDKLKLYSILMFAVSLIIRIIYGTYCNRNFSENKFQWFWDQKLFKKMMGFAGWNLFGNGATIIVTHGVNLLSNIFFGPAINAARGIATQVSNAIWTFAINFQTALNPQIIKTYSTGEYKVMQSLMVKSSKFSYYLLLLISLPVLFEMEQLLNLWLTEVPPYAVLFAQLMLIRYLIDTMSNSLIVGAQAAGNIRIFQSATGALTLLNILITYIFFKTGYPPETTIIVSISISFLLLITRLLILKTMINFSIILFINKVIYKVLAVTILSIPLPFYINQTTTESLFRFLLSTTTIINCVLLSVFAIGLEKEERILIVNYIRTIIRRIRISFAER